MVRRGTPEGLVKAAVLDYLRVRGFFAWNNPTGAVEIRPGQWMRFGKVGSSDILGCLPDGRFLAVEVKAPGGRLSPEQRQFLADIRDLGGLALAVRNWKEIDNALREGGYVSDGPLFEAPDSPEKIDQTAVFGNNKDTSGAGTRKEENEWPS